MYTTEPYEVFEFSPEDSSIPASYKTDVAFLKKSKHWYVSLITYFVSQWQIQLK